jgi:transposase-like protein
MNESEARRLITEALRKAGSMAAMAGAIGCHRSLLYQFAREGGSFLGPQVVSKMRSLHAFQSVTSEAWLVAMGVVDLPPESHEAKVTHRGPKRKT